MKKLLLLLALMLSVASSAFAVEAEIGGLWYELVPKGKVAKVIRYKNYVKYSGDIVIPETVEDEGAKVDKSVQRLTDEREGKEQGSDLI